MHRFTLKHPGLRTKLLVSYILLGAFGAALLICVLHVSYRSQLRQKVRADLPDLVSVAALNVDAETHAQPRNPSDQSTAAYLSLQADFREIDAVGQDIVFVYSMRRNEDLEWGITHWFPQTAQAGWKYWAIVQPEKIMARVTMQQLVEDYAKERIAVSALSLRPGVATPYGDRFYEQHRY
jgi:hypothetical protein